MLLDSMTKNALVKVANYKRLTDRAIDWFDWLVGWIGWLVGWLIEAHVNIMRCARRGLLFFGRVTN